MNERPIETRNDDIKKARLPTIDLSLHAGKGHLLFLPNLRPIRSADYKNLYDDENKYILKVIGVTRNKCTFKYEVR